MLELLLDISPAVVSFHFGLPEGETILRLRRQDRYPGDGNLAAGGAAD